MTQELINSLPQAWKKSSVNSLKSNTFNTDFGTYRSFIDMGIITSVTTTPYVPAVEQLVNGILYCRTGSSVFNFPSGADITTYMFSNIDPTITSIDEYKFSVQFSNTTNLPINVTLGTGCTIEGSNSFTIPGSNVLTYGTMQKIITFKNIGGNIWLVFG